MAENQSTDAAATDPVVAEMRRKAGRYGAGYAIASEAFKGKGVDRMVLGAKIVIGVIVVYALFSAVTVGLSG